MDGDDAAPHDFALRARRRRRRRFWSRVALAVVLTPIGLLGLGIAGPLGLVAVFVPLMLIAMAVDWAFGAHRRAARKVDLRERRRRQMEHAIENGGPSDAPAPPHESPDPNAAEGALFGRRFPGLVSGIWPRGRI